MKSLQNFLKKLQKFRNERTAFDFFDRTAQTCNKWGYFAGLSILDPNYKLLNIRIICAFSFLFSFVFINIYSINIKKSVKIDVFMSSVTFGMLLQGFVKLFTYAKNCVEVKEIAESGYGLYNDLQENRIKKIARDIAFVAWIFVTKFLFVAYIAAFQMAIWVPVIYSYTFAKKNELAVEVELPFTNIQTHVGYWLNLGFLLVASFYELIGLLASDGFYLLLLLNGLTQLENIFFETELLNDLIERKRPKEQVSKKVNNIIKLHQKYIR